MTGLLVVLAVLVLATAVGLWRRASDGRVRPTTPARSADAPAVAAASTPVAGADPPTGQDRPAARDRQDRDRQDRDQVDLAALGAVGGSRATLLQFSSAFCAPCRTARVVLGDVAKEQPDVAHVEVDAESHLDLVVAMGVRRTPTTLVLDATGRVVGRAVGAPRKAEVLAALSALGAP